MKKSDNGKLIGIILGAVGGSVVIGIISGFLGYNFYKKRNINRPKVALSYN